MEILFSNRGATDTARRTSLRLLQSIVLAVQATIPISHQLAKQHYVADMVSFFYLQVFATGAILLVVSLFSRWRFVSIVSGALLGLSALITFGSTPAPTASLGGGRCLSVMTVNVLGPNRQTSELETEIENVQPDVILVQEAQPFWRARFKTWQDYPYRASEAIGHIWDVEILSRRPLTKVARPYPLRNGVRTRESLKAVYSLGEDDQAGTEVILYVVHPQTPRDHAGWMERNEFLREVGREIANEKSGSAIIVGGDFNTPIWSPAFHEFVKDTGLIRASGSAIPWATRFFSPVLAPITGTPIDHILADPGFKVRDTRIGPAFGSDHLPVSSILCR